MSSGSKIRIAAAVVLNEQGETLLVRKLGTSIFMQPGGKVAFGESAVDAPAREIAEELGCAIDRNAAFYAGRFQAPAANEPGWTIDADLFVVSLFGEPHAQAEIAEIAWILPTDVGDLVVAPLTRDFAQPIACGTAPSTL